MLDEGIRAFEDSLMEDRTEAVEKSLKAAQKEKKKQAAPPPAAAPQHTRETPAWKTGQNYLQAWRNRAAVPWKFHKLTQVWLLRNMYEKEQVADETFAIMIDYLEGLKGAGRTKTLQDAEKLLAESADAAEADAEGPAAQKSERASQVITVLQRPEQ